MTDQDLVERARQGDASAFGELVVRHHRAALRAAMAALGSLDEADDAVQEGWISARAQLALFRGDACFRTWLLAIVWNKARDRRRSAVRALKRLVAFADAGSDATGPNRPVMKGMRSGELDTLLSDRHPDASPEQALLSGQLRTALTRLVRALPAKLRDPLLLVGSGDYTYAEVAAMLDQPVGTVKWRVSEARRVLSAKLARLGF